MAKFGFGNSSAPFGLGMPMWKQPGPPGQTTGGVASSVGAPAGGAMPSVGAPTGAMPGIPQGQMTLDQWKQNPGSNPTDIFTGFLSSLMNSLHGKQAAPPSATPPALHDAPADIQRLTSMTTRPMETNAGGFLGGLFDRMKG